MNLFATNLNKMLDQQPETAAAATTPASTPADADEEPEGASDGSPSIAPAGEKGSSNGKTKADAPATDGGDKDIAATGGPTVRKINGPAAAPIELSDVAGSAILKRALPLVGGLALLWIVIRRFTRR